MTREEAVIILDGFKNNPLFSDTHVQALDMAIASLKTDEQYNLLMEKPFDICENWIPCTEQLPKNNTWVLYSDKNGVVSDCHYYNGFNQFEHSNGEHEMTDIIAWMPLPKPYKAERGE